MREEDVIIMRFREHRGGLDESLATMVEVNNLAGLLDHIHSVFLWPHVTDADLSFEPYGGDDDRIGWKDVHAVLLKGSIIGFVEGIPK